MEKKDTIKPQDALTEDYKKSTGGMYGGDEKEEKEVLIRSIISGMQTLLRTGAIIDADFIQVYFELPHLTLPQLHTAFEQLQPMLLHPRAMRGSGLWDDFTGAVKSFLSPLSIMGNLPSILTSADNYEKKGGERFSAGMGYRPHRCE